MYELRLRLSCEPSKNGGSQYVFVPKIDRPYSKHTRPKVNESQSAYSMNPLRTIGRSVGRNLLSFQNSRVVAPPGDLLVRDGQPVIVASLMRSGTHLAIDLLLNNFIALRRRPLYVDLDKYVLAGRTAYSVKQGGSYVVKTHFPQAAKMHKAADVCALARESSVLLVHRELTACSESLQRFNTNCEVDEQIATRHREFWSHYNPLNIDFEEMVDAEKCKQLLGRISSHLGLPLRDKIILPRGRNSRAAVYTDKALTRILGRRAWRVNTTISFR